MPRLILATAALLACAGLAHAECTCDGVDNCLGVYFDQGLWTQTCLDPVPVGQPFHMYFVLKNSVFDALGGFEFGMRFDPEPIPAMFILSVTYPFPVFIDPGVYNVHYGSGLPIPATGPVVFMDVLWLALGPVVTIVELGPPTPASLPGHAALNDFYDPANIVAINFPCPVGPDGWTIEPVAQLGQCVTPVEAAAWSRIKALYR